MHTGSQGCDFSLLAKSVRVIMDFIKEINAARAKEKLSPISFFDIGGGHPVDYTHQNSSGNGNHVVSPTEFTEYAKQLRELVPELWESEDENVNNLKFLTEFGRSLSAGAGYAISRVEYTKESGGTKIATVHFGADFLLRNAYMPDKVQEFVTHSCDFSGDTWLMYSLPKEFEKKVANPPRRHL